MSYEFTVDIEFDYVKGLLPVFTHTDGPNPFDIEEWPDIRTQLREAVLEDIPDEFEVFLNSDRVGERYAYTIGTVLVDEENGELVEKRYDSSVSSLRDAFDLD